MTKAQKSESEPKLTSGQYYGTGNVAAIEALGILGNSIYRSKKDVTLVHQTKERDLRSDITPVRTRKFEE